MMAYQKIRNILITGIAGPGKSTLGNTILGRLSEVGFTESELMETCSQSCVVKEKVDGGCLWRVFDTAGLGDPNKSRMEEFVRLADVARKVKGGVHCVIFAYSGRLLTGEIDAFHLLNEVLYPHNVPLIAVRTNFSRFQNQDVVNRARVSAVATLNQKLGTRFREGDVLFVNNPPDDEATRSISRTVLRAKILSNENLVAMKGPEVAMAKKRELEEAVEKKRLEELERQRLEKRRKKLEEEKRKAEEARRKRDEDAKRLQEKMKQEEEKMRKEKEKLAKKIKNTPPQVVYQYQSSGGGGGGICSIQ